MPNVVYVSKSRIQKINGPHRRAQLPVGQPIDLGVHGSIKEHYKLGGPDLPLPVDYVVAATGA